MKKSKFKKLDSVSSIDRMNLNDAYTEILGVNRKLEALAGLLLNKSTDESGSVDLDNKSVGLGEIIQEQVKKLEACAETVSRFSVS